MTTIRLSSRSAADGEVPLNEADGHLPEVISAASERGASAYLTDHGRRVAAILPSDDAWYWAPGWQAAEAEADAAYCPRTPSPWASRSSPSLSCP
ncbi:type II toxin-antitoxin system Phd/YefM family antitoxin [Nonomuraea sp. NBC_00507]|uniref:hypothetical protein n=1 Tax=Nonomuraea sp. NBC_00507 TaxID=2976002 RepID=UPI002E1798E0